MSKPTPLEYGQHERKQWDPVQPWPIAIGAALLSTIFWIVYALALFRGNNPGPLSLWGFVFVTCVAGVVFSLSAVALAHRRDDLSGGLLLVAGYTICNLVFLFLVMPWVMSWLSSRSPCPERLRTIGVGLFLYAHDHGGRMPDNLEQLVQAKYIEAKDLTCPFGDAGHVDTYYKYVVGGRSAGAVLGDEVIVYEPVEIHGGGANVLYGDGHVEWIDASGFQRWVIEEVGKNTDRSENGQPTVR